uniref:Ribonuclease H-like domain-containing protein n=1 Tax=Tanacetum cinerariifolium TaxID=118510 RepID=A0A6L2L2F9_TANCI|nr:ribonuclease H-like domain-containing protein [Tanacetum cinerariifolium]
MNSLVMSEENSDMNTNFGSRRIDQPRPIQLVTGLREKAAEQEAKDDALIEQMEDVQARIDADALLAERLQQEEREQFTVDEQARILVDLIAERKSFKEIQMLYEREQKWINDFVPMDFEEVNDSEQQAKGSKKTSRLDHDKESVKKQKLKEADAKKEELRACLDIVPIDDIAIDVESLATKYPIVDWKTHTLIKNMMYYQIIRANGNSKNYKILTEMCDGFDRQDIKDLYRLVKERYETASPKGYDLLLWRDLITLFEPSEEDEDLNLKFLRSLPSEWNTHVVVWKNNSDIDTISIDDLYNNFKIIEQEVKGTTCSDLSSQNMAFVTSPSTNSINEVSTTYGVSTASTQSSTVIRIIMKRTKSELKPDKIKSKRKAWDSPTKSKPGCALLRKKFKKDMFTYCFEKGILQDSFEPFYDNNNVVNALREPFVINQDPSKNSSQSPPQINHHCCYECGDPLEDIFCHQCTCELCGRGAHYGYNCPPKVLVVLDPEPFNNQTVDELPQTLPSFDIACYSEDGNSFTYDSTSNLVKDSPNFPIIHQPIHEKTCAELLAQEQEANIDTQSFQYSVVPQPPQEEMSVEFLQEKRNQIDYDNDEDYAIAVIPSLSNEEPVNSLNQFEDFSVSNDGSTLNDFDSFSIDDNEYVEASPPNSELVSSEVMEIIIPEVGGIDDDILLTIKDDILREKLLNINLLIANIEAINDNPTPSSNFMTKSSSNSLNSLLEETKTIDNSLLELETFCFDMEEIISGSTTTRSDISLPEYEAFYDDHVKEISIGSTTTHSDSSLYDSFIFDISINLFPPADKSDFYEFADELTHIISPPDYDCFCFMIEPNSGDFTMDVVEDILTREKRVHNALPTHPTFLLNMDFILSSEFLFAYVVWIFLPFLSYSVAPQNIQSFGNEDTIFDPDIFSYHISSFMPDVSHQSGTFIKFKVLNESPKDI